MRRSLETEAMSTIYRLAGVGQDEKGRMYVSIWRYGDAAAGEQSTVMSTRFFLTLKDRAEFLDKFIYTEE